MRRLSLADVAQRVDDIDPAPLIHPADAKARRELEEARGAAYTDNEWREAKDNLAAFFAVLAEWESARQ
jgi:hypothetical protein